MDSWDLVSSKVFTFGSKAAIAARRLFALWFLLLADQRFISRGQTPRLLAIIIFTAGKGLWSQGDLVPRHGVFFG
jgi:hypothetical protein